MYAVSLPAVLVGSLCFPHSRGASLPRRRGGRTSDLYLVGDARAQSPSFGSIYAAQSGLRLPNLSSLINYSATFAMTFLTASTSCTSGVSTRKRQASYSWPACSSDGVLADRRETGGSSTRQACGLRGDGLMRPRAPGLTFVGTTTPLLAPYRPLVTLGVGFGFFAPSITHAIMGSVGKREVGVATATLATMRVAGQNMSLGLATLVLALVVGQHEIEPADYPHVLTSVRITFAIFTALCMIGLIASYVGQGRRTQSV